MPDDPETQEQVPEKSAETAPPKDKHQEQLDRIEGLCKTILEYTARRP
jgi:hypothetical protein